MSLPYSGLAHLFLEVRTQIKLYHWKTRSYARHKATDRFIETFEPLVDRFVEAAQGIDIAQNGPDAPRIADFDNLLSHQQKRIHHFAQDELNDKTGAEFLTQFRRFLATVALPQSELAQIRDDMLEIVDVTLYLFTLQ